MVLSVEKLGLFPLKHNNNNSTSLDDFRSKISNFIAQILHKTGTPKSLEFFQNCFELINITNRAFAKLVVEINHPTSQWGGKLTEGYLSYTLNLLDLVNSVTTSVSRLNQAKISVLHAVTLIKKKKNYSPDSKNYLKKIPRGNIQAKISVFGFNEGTPVSDHKERAILQALMALKKIVFLTMGFVVSGLYSEPKIYLEIRKLIPCAFDDPLMKMLDSRFLKETIDEMEEVKEVNRAVEVLCGDTISDGRFDEAVEELNGRLEVLESSIHGIEKQANTLFSEVLGTRNKLLDNIRLMG